MNKTQLIDAVAQGANLKKKDAEAAVAAMVDTISAAMQKGEKVQIVGFGTFEVKERAARSGRNPKTGEAISGCSAVFLPPRCCFCSWKGASFEN